MKNNKKLIITAIALFMILISPIAFADSDNNINKKLIKFEDKIEMQANKGNPNSNSIWNRIMRYLKERDNDSDVKPLYPVISSITAPTVLKINETGTWIIKAEDPQNQNLEYSVDFGDNKRFLSMKRDESNFVQTATFTHAYSEKGTYTITFRVRNSSGLEAKSTVTVHVIENNNVSAPVISDLKATSTRPYNARIEWKTDVRSTSSLWFSKNSPVDTSKVPNISRPAKVYNHKIELAELEPNTKYYVIVASTNNGGTTMSSQTSFVTPAERNSGSPVIKSIVGDNEVTVGETLTVKINAYDPNNKTLTYSAKWGDEAQTLSPLTDSIFVQTATLTHVYNTPGVYTAKFTVENSDGKMASSSIEITVKPSYSDTVAPVISDLETRVGQTSATISWETNEPSNSTILYGIITPVNESNSELKTSASLVTDHSLEITNLKAKSLYHFVLKSSDISGNQTVSSEFAFMTN